MYFLGLFAVFYICYVCYKRWISIPDYPAFGEDSECSQESVTQLMEYKVHSINTVMKCYSTDDKDDFISHVFDLWKDTEDLLYEVNYVQREEEYTCISRNLDIINSLPYDSVKKVIFARSPLKAQFKFDKNISIDITDIINRVIGPKLNFHSDITSMTVDDLYVYMCQSGIFERWFDSGYDVIKNNNYTLEIDDNLGDSYFLKSGDSLVWNPLLTTKNKEV